MRRAALALSVVVALTGCRSRLLTAGGADLGTSAGALDLATAPTGPDLAPPIMFSRVHNDVPGCAVVGIAAADFDGDGVSDLALACGPANVTNTAELLLGNGDGTYRDTVLASVGIYFAQVAAADFDGTGKLHLVALAHQNAHEQLVDFGPNNQLVGGNGSPGTLTGMGVADFDGDGKSDVAVAAEQLPGTALYFGQDGIFYPNAPPPALTLAETGLGRAAAADLDGDGQPDVAVGTDGAHIDIIKGSKGTFSLLTTVAVPASGAADVLGAGDLDGDGLADVLVSGADGIYLVTNHGGFSARRIAALSTNVSDGAIGDLDGDGGKDFAIATGLGVFWYRQDAGTFSQWPIESGSGFAAVAIGDANGDGRRDVIVGSNGSVDVFVRR